MCIVCAPNRRFRELSLQFLQDGSVPYDQQFLKGRINFRSRSLQKVIRILRYDVQQFLHNIYDINFIGCKRLVHFSEHICVVAEHCQSGLRYCVYFFIIFTYRVCLRAVGTRIGCIFQRRSIIFAARNLELCFEAFNFKPRCSSQPVTWLGLLALAGRERGLHLTGFGIFLRRPRANLSPRRLVFIVTLNCEALHIIFCACQFKTVGRLLMRDHNFAFSLFSIPRIFPFTHTHRNKQINKDSSIVYGHAGISFGAAALRGEKVQR